MEREEFIHIWLTGNPLLVSSESWRFVAVIFSTVTSNSKLHCRERGSVCVCVCVSWREKGKLKWRPDQTFWIFTNPAFEKKKKKIIEFSSFYLKIHCFIIVFSNIPLRFLINFRKIIRNYFSSKTIIKKTYFF